MLPLIEGVWPRYQQHITCNIECRTHDDRTLNNGTQDKNRNGGSGNCFLIFANGTGYSFEIEGVMPNVADICPENCDFNQLGMMT